MSFDRQKLAEAIAVHGPVARIVIAETAGSAPRERGAEMLVWATGQTGTIGGGALEFEAAERAREILASRKSRVTRHALGPDLGQCCGGRVTLVTEVWSGERLAEIGEEVVARPLEPGSPMPLSVSRLLAGNRNGTRPLKPMLKDGWMIEPISRPTRALWIWGAGHVGRALVATLAPLPELAITWVDTDQSRFPGDIPEGVEVLADRDPVALVAQAPVDAEHIVLTYSHALDLALCNALLAHGSRDLGLIGSGTKWARFRSRLSSLGHSAQAIARIRCPIGRPSFGKHPQAIALGVAADLLASATTARREQTG